MRKKSRIYDAVKSDERVKHTRKIASAFSATSPQMLLTQGGGISLIDHPSPERGFPLKSPDFSNLIGLFWQVFFAFERFDHPLGVLKALTSHASKCAAVAKTKYSRISKIVEKLWRFHLTQRDKEGRVVLYCGVGQRMYGNQL